jgi:hypothetical protein
VPLSRNLVTLTSWKLLGHSRPVTGLLYIYLKYYIKKTLTSWIPLAHSRPVTGLFYIYLTYYIKQTAASLSNHDESQGKREFDEK